MAPSIFKFGIRRSTFVCFILHLFPPRFLSLPLLPPISLSLLSLCRPCSCFRHLTSSMHRPYPPTPFIFGFLCLQLIKYSQAKSQSSTQSSIPLCHFLISSATTFLLCKSFLIYHHHCTPHMCHFAHCRLSCISPLFFILHVILQSVRFPFSPSPLVHLRRPARPLFWIAQDTETEGMDYRRRSFANQRSIINSRYNLIPPNSLHVAKLQATYST